MDPRINPLPRACPSCLIVPGDECLETCDARAIRMAAPRSGKCNGCGASVTHFGQCQACAEKAREREHWARMGRALRSIPEHYRWARWGAPLLYERVPDLVNVSASPVALLDSRILLLHGESGAGKTSLGCALLRYLIESTSPESDRGIIERAEGARFIDVRTVPPSKTAEDERGMVGAARRATVLLLDDALQEAGAGDGYVSHERCRIVSDLLEWRYQRERPTIVTTGGDAAAWSAAYGGGIMRRYWESDDARVVELRRGA